MNWFDKHLRFDIFSRRDTLGPSVEVLLSTSWCGGAQLDLQFGRLGRKADGTKYQGTKRLGDIHRIFWVLKFDFEKWVLQILKSD